MEASKRIKSIVKQLNYKTLADIGTDHAYVPISAAKMGKVEKVIATDINKGPLEKALLNIKKYKLEHIVEIRLGEGLDPVAPGETECAVISGMGGMLIIDILKKDVLKNNNSVIKSLKQLILQPQLDIDKVRRYIHSIGFKIEDEIMLCEDKYYTVLNCAPGDDIYYSDIDYNLGKILLDRNDYVLKSYAKSRVNALKKIKAFMENGGESRKNTRYNQLTKEIGMYEEVMKL